MYILSANSLENSPPAWLAAATTGSVTRRAKHAGSQTPREHTGVFSCHGVRPARAGLLW